MKIKYFSDPLPPIPFPGKSHSKGNYSALMTVCKNERRHGDGSSVPKRSVGRREDGGTVPCGKAGYA